MAKLFSLVGSHFPICPQPCPPTASILHTPEVNPPKTFQTTSGSHVQLDKIKMLLGFSLSDFLKQPYFDHSLTQSIVTFSMTPETHSAQFQPHACLKCPPSPVRLRVPGSEVKAAYLHKVTILNKCFFESFTSFLIQHHTIIGDVCYKYPGLSIDPSACFL